MAKPLASGQRLIRSARTPNQRRRAKEQIKSPSVTGSAAPSFNNVSPKGKIDNHMGSLRLRGAATQPGAQFRRLSARVNARLESSVGIK